MFRECRASVTETETRLFLCLSLVFKTLEKVFPELGIRSADDLQNMYKNNQ
jgi:hypothetical protein